MNKMTAVAAALVLTLATTVAQAQAMRPEVGKPLQAASELLKAGKSKEALAKVREAEAVGGKTAAEALQEAAQIAAVAMVARSGSVASSPSK